jgi:hypothetical protein
MKKAYLFLLFVGLFAFLSFRMPHTTKSIQVEAAEIE